MPPPPMYVGTSAAMKVFARCCVAGKCAVVEMERSAEDGNPATAADATVDVVPLSVL